MNQLGRPLRAPFCGGKSWLLELSEGTEDEQLGL